MLAVINAPLVRLASTTTVPSGHAGDRLRLRMGKDCLSALRLNGNCVDDRAAARDAFE